jgi:hypothetical protein
VEDRDFHSVSDDADTATPQFDPMNGELEETMSDERTEPLNAFSEPYLKAVHELDDPATAHEADTSGPFSLVEEGGMIALYHAWESSERGDAPLAVFHRRETALLFQAIWPAIGRSSLYRLRNEPDARGFGVEEDGEVVANLRSFDPVMIVGGHLAACLARSPLSLALLVEAAGPTAQKHVGRILGARLLGGR